MNFWSFSWRKTKMSDISRTWTSGKTNEAGHVIVLAPPTRLPTLWYRTFHPGALDLPKEHAFMEELSSQKLASSEHSAATHLRLSPGSQPGLDFLQPPSPLQLQNFLIHRDDQLLEEDQGTFQSSHLLLIAWREVTWS